MSTASLLAYKMLRGAQQGTGISKTNVLHGEDIFGAKYSGPRRMDEFVGQEQARWQLITAITAAKTRGVALPHVLLASGAPGIGKTTLAKLIAYTMGVGFVELGGNVTVKDVKPVLMGMADGDVLFIDEIHQLVATKRTNAEWLLQVLQDGTLVTPQGAVQVPAITVIGASTDTQKLQKPILDRFAIQPLLEGYTEDEACQIAVTTAARIGVTMTPLELRQVAAAGDCNPRIIGRLIEQVRDIKVAKVDGDVVATALKWAGFSYDGLSRLEQDYLMLMLGYGGTASQGTMKAVLNESVLDQSERALISKGFITITSKGRELTELGITRAKELLEAAA